MEEWISYSKNRYGEWKGHKTKRAVCQAIAWDTGGLRIYAKGVDMDNWVTYTEVPRADWERVFGAAGA